MQRWPKDRADDRGGWRYIDDGGTNSQYDSDLSITGWHLMFLRSARNAGFNVPKQPIDDAVGYVRRCYSQQHGVFEYCTGDDDDRSRAMAGAGILALAPRWLSRRGGSSVFGRVASPAQFRQVQHDPAFGTESSRSIPLRTLYQLPGNVSAWRSLLAGILSTNSCHAPGKATSRRFLARGQPLARRPIWPGIHNGACGHDARRAESTFTDFPTLTEL